MAGTKEQVVISGISGRFPQSDNIEEFWDNLINGVDMVTTDTRRWPIGFLGIPERKGTLKVDLTKFDANFFGVYPKQAERVDPQIRQLFEVTYEAIVDAGVNPTTIRGANIGVFVGASAHDTFEACRKHPDIASGYDITGSSCCMLANRISYAFDFHGPSYCIDTFCSSSMMALHQGYQAIMNGECDAAIVSGVNLLMNPMTSLQIQRVGALAPDGKCKVFDIKGNGFVRSEAIVTLFIQKKSVARRSYGTIIHTKTNTDGFKINGVSYPSGKAQQKLLEDTYAESGVNPHDIFYVEPHGTGTEAGDPQEVNAITEVFTPGRQDPLLLGATKSNMGHAEPAAALCAVTKTVLSLKNGVIPSNLHFNIPNANIPALLDGRIKVVNKNRPVTGSLVGVNSTGLGGSNIHVIIEENKHKTQAQIPPMPVLLPISGRTEEGVQFALDKINSQERNFEFESLLQNIAEETIPLHPYRGFIVLEKDSSSPAVIDVQEVPAERPPLWFVFSGMGTLWRGMTKDLMEFDMFAESIRKSDEILKTFGLDLYEILTNGTEEELNANMGTCFVAMGVAFIDMLAAIGLKPDGFIGHSAGELMCGYADGCISQRDALICYYFKDICVAKCTGGGMASVGLTWEEAEKRCPEGVFPACHNAENNVTVSGPADKIKKFIEDLKAEGVFAREVSTGGVAYHSPYLAPILPLFDAYTSAVIIDPKPRSSKWISTSIPESEWVQPISKIGSASYVVNNMKSPVLFHGALKYIPSNAVVLEVSAHAIFVGMLKKALPKTCNVMGLVRRGTGNNVTQFLTAVGKLYQLGYDVNLSAIYPAVEYPVPASTPAISTLVKWDHSTTFPLPDYIFNSSGAGESSVEVSLANDTDAFLAGHNIDGRILFPATGYLELVWKKFASMNGKPYENFPVEFENVRFERATIMPKEGNVKFQVSITAKTGEFSISEGDSVAVSGIIKCGAAQTKTIEIEELKSKSEHTPMTNEDVYKELRLQSYEYSGIFKGIRTVDNEGRWAKLAWNNNWVSFLDTMMQFPVVNKTTRGLFIPTRLQKVKIDPQAFRKFVENNAVVETEGIPAGFTEKLNVIKCQGVEIIGLKTSAAPRKALNQASPVIEEARFVSYFDPDHSKCTFETFDAVLKYFVDLMIENSSSMKLNIIENVTNIKDALAPKVLTNIQIQPLRLANILVVSDNSDQIISQQLESLGINVTSKSKIPVDNLVNVVVCDKERDIDSESSVSFKDGTGFILYHTNNMLGENYLKSKNLEMVSRKYFSEKWFYLFKKNNNVSSNPPPPIVINIDENKTFEWFSTLRDAMIKSANDKEFPRIYLFSTQEATSGLIGLVNCLRQEPGGNKVRCVFSTKKIDFTKNGDSQIAEILNKDMVMNVIDEKCQVGSYRHALVDISSCMVQQTKFAYVNVENRGDLSSLRFIEAPLPSTVSSGNDKLYDIYYAPLNFRDIMLASGKLPPEALPGKLSTQECILGLEFVGKDADGERIMGMVEAKGLATHVLTDSKFIWKVPKHWSMEEAATVPVAYSTAYYAIIVRGRMRSGESILIHSGSGGVGQAAIAIALSMNCIVYTTVGSLEKKSFLMKQFPQLKPENFSNSRDTTFEEHIMTQTDGRGVDLVLNSLAEEKLQASVRCVAEGGRFLEIGKFDLSRNNSLGMAVFLKNVTFHGILLDALFDKYPQDQSEVIQLLTNGIDSGTVHPLPRVVFQKDQIEDAFRFMANGKHMGKVLLQIKDENSEGNSTFPTTVPAKIRTYFNPSHSYIIIGGLGGFGLELAGWMVRRNARKLVLVSRSHVKNGYQQLSIRRWNASGVNVVVSQHDVTTEAGVTELLSSASRMGPVGGIFNLAMVLKDGFIENQTLENFQTVCRPKVAATVNLDKLSRELCPELEYFVVFSSAASGKGNIGQTNYGYANSTMERICESRRKHNLHGLAIQWGAIGDVGVILNAYGGNDIILGGTVPQRLSSCLNVLDIFLKDSINTRSLSPIVASTVIPEVTSGGTSNSEKPSLITSVAKILGLRNNNYPSSETTLGELGIDSLMAVEIEKTLQNHSDLTLSTNAIRELTWGKLECLDKGEKIEETET